MHSSFPESGGSTATLLRGQSGTGGAQLELLSYLVSSYLNKYKWQEKKYTNGQWPSILQCKSFDP